MDPVVAQFVAGVGAVRRYSYLVIALPPLFVGVVQVSDTCVLPAVAVKLVGAPGVVAGVAVCGPDVSPMPTALTGRTSKV